MRYSYVLAVSCSIVLLVGLQFSSASSALRINETATKALIKGERVEVALAINNPSDSTVAARVKLEIIDPRNRVRAVAEQDATIMPGPSTLDFPLQLSISDIESQELLWYRLRYHVNPGPIEGNISLSEITTDIFQLGIIKPMFTLAATRYKVRIRAAHPVSARAVSGVKVEAAIELDEKRLSPLQSPAVTDSNGYATFDFDLPRDIKTSAGDLKVTGQRNGIRAEAESRVRFDNAARIAISSDKVIYQPGQTLHVRALAFTPLRRAMAGTDLKLKILDPENGVVYREALKTSRFGIASADWAIPENARLGDYTVWIGANENNENDAYSYPYRIRISRYELPNFAVTVNPDRSYYLPGQNAEVEVRGDYLFGRPVTEGRVRVVRETERNWNYREQKWEIEEEDSFEGELDKTGRFIARIDLKEKHQALAENDYSQFKNISYAAYVTDRSTNRTEQRRFDLRTAKEPIQVYLIAGDERHANAPFEFYISTFYADGTPAQCEVTISEDALTGSKSRARRKQTMRTIKTNRYGVAKVNGFVSANSKSNESDEVELNFVARDGKGLSGHKSESLSVSSSQWVRIETDKTIYRAGEPVRLQVIASEPAARVFVDIMQGRKVIRSESIKLRNGRTAFTLPYSAEFKNEIMMTAYFCDDVDRATVSTRSVFYPRDHELKLDLRMSAQTYRPGDEASADFRVQTADNRVVESALGITITDRAVEERARTDVEFGSQGFSYPWLDDGESLAGVSRSALDKLDPSKPIPDGLDLVAEILLSRHGYYLDYSTDRYLSQRDAFTRVIEAQMDPIKNALDSRYSRKAEYPTNARRLELQLASAGIEFGEMRDPWGTPYRALFSVRNETDVMNLMSAGADKRFDTNDDFAVAEKSWPYFRNRGEAIDRAINEYHKRTGGFIRDRATLARELLKIGIDVNTLKDRWGKHYDFRFGLSEKYYTMSIISGGANGILKTEADYDADDFTIWTSKSDYFAETYAEIDGALTNYFKASEHFPQDEAELSKALGRAGIEWENLHDPWGRRYYAVFESHTRYSDRVRAFNYARYREETKPQTEITPVTLQINSIYVRSAGEDGNRDTADDFGLAGYSRIVSERPAKDRPAKDAPDKDGPAQLVRASSGFSAATGAISGVVTDEQGAVIPATVVKATSKASLMIHKSTSNEDGMYLLIGLSDGLYDVQFDASGFSTTVIADVPVRSSNVTEVNATLNPSGVSEAVVVMAGAEPVFQTASATMTEVITRRPAGATISSKPQSVQMATPRLRQYFPETLLWQPSLETDSEGRARLKFKLADNITTWNIEAVASTVDGEIGIVKKEVLAFQPFFIEHDPPRVLTQGDEISLPVVLRNYLDKLQTVDVEMKPESWFEVTGPERKQIKATPGEAAQAVFHFRAVAAVENGRQRVTALSDAFSDSVEKRVTVHPDGEEKTQTVGQVLGDTATIEMNIPANAIKDTARAELKIYPNLMAHVTEGIEAIMKRPYGCAEQTISSTYPSILVLRYYKQRGEDFPPVAERARRYAQAGYERLLNYSAAQGGFSYWGKGDADLALTAYALRFLNDAREFVAVDESVIEKTHDWIIQQQRADGSWGAQYSNNREDRRRTATLTAFVARVLATTESKRTVKANNDQKNSITLNLTRALDYLTQLVTAIDEPYFFASYALAAIDANQMERAAKAIIKLRALARRGSDTNYWPMETHTPFYGWGLAGDVETTALAVQALTLAAGKEQKNGKDAAAKNDEMISRGLLFLLRQKDRFGVWYSTQTTVNVFDALTAVLSSYDTNDGSIKTDGAAEIIINGKPATSVAIPTGNQSSNPLAIDISAFISIGSNRIEIRRPSGSDKATAQVVAAHYAPWPASADKKEATGAIRLRVGFDKTELRIGEEVTCDVQAERARGYGMMLAEIGLPPGADVDRASLDRAMKESDYGLDRYDVLPDKLVVYLWPRAGKTQFQFKFKPRFGIYAKTAPSVIYDYYNPDARAVVAPSKFSVY